MKIDFKIFNAELHRGLDEEHGERNYSLRHSIPSLRFFLSRLTWARWINFPSW